MKIAILGYGVEGQAAYAYWSKASDNHLTICDEDPAIEVPEGAARKIGPDYLKNLAEFDLIVRSPGIHPQKIIDANLDDALIPTRITSGTNEFYRVSPTKQLIGVTGTKGKGTTSTLIYELLKAAGQTVYLAGNIGVPALSLLEHNLKPTDWVVLEQSSFQLKDCQYSPAVAVCLMVVPEHLNWHTDMADYLTSKQQLFAHQTADDIAVYNRASEFSTQIIAASPAHKIGYEVPEPGAELVERAGVFVEGDTIYAGKTEVAKVSDVALLGRHNLQNVCAAIAAVWPIIKGDTKLIQSVLKKFKGLPHRLEKVAEIKGVTYYDDSFGTTPETAIVALQAFQEPKVVILGGSDKNVDFTELAHAVKDANVRAVVTIGATAEKIEAALKAAGFDNIVSGGDTMKAIVTTATKQAQSGDVVLLSTGCASFGLFKDYKDRGDQFKAAVTALR